MYDGCMNVCTFSMVYGYGTYVVGYGVLHFKVVSQVSERIIHVEFSSFFLIH